MNPPPALRVATSRHDSPHRAVFNEIAAQWAQHLEQHHAAAPKLPPATSALLLRLREGLQPLADTTATDHARQRLLARANALADTPERDVVQQRRDATDLALIEWDDLTLALATGDHAMLQEQNLTLESRSVQDLLAQTHEVLRLQAINQQATRALRLVQQLETSSGQSQAACRALTEALFDTLQRSWAYDTASHGDLLVFEAAANLLLRGDQVEALALFLNTPGEWVRQMPMGFGKTKVLLPLLVQRLADGERVVMCIMPEPLILANAGDLETSLRVFGKHVEVFRFRRYDAQTPEALDILRGRLTDVAAARSAMVTSRISELSLLLTYHEQLHKMTTVSKWVNHFDQRKERLMLLADILRLRSRRSTALIDEVDQALDVRQEVNFSLGCPKSVQSDFRNLVADLYETFTRPQQATALHLLRCNQQSLMTPEQLRIWQQTAVEHVFATHAVLRDALSVDDRAEAIAFVLGQSDILHERVQRWHAQADTRLMAQLLTLLRQQLCDLMPMTLRRHGSEHYGLVDQALAVAVPFDRGELKSGCEFANPYEVINYTLQAYLHESRGVTPDDVLAALDILRTRLDTSLAITDDVDELPGMQVLNQLRAGTAIEASLLLRCHAKDKPELAEFAKSISRSPSKILLFVREFVLPNVRFHTEQLGASAYDLLAMHGRVHGFSGTPWNAATYAHRLSVATTPQTDGLCARILANTDKTRVQVIDDTNPAALLKSVAGSCADFKLRALIDSGAVLRGMSNNDVVNHLVAYFSPQGRGIDHVIYYDERKQAFAVRNVCNTTTRHMSGTSATELLALGLQPERTFTYYDTMRSFATDLPQAPDAAAIVTVGELTTLFNLQQGMLRMRQLAQQQRCVLAVPALLAQSFAAAPSAATVVQHTLENQAKLLGSDKVRGLRRLLMSEVRHVVHQRCLQGPVEQAIKLFQAMRPMLVQQVSDDPYLLFGSGRRQATRLALKEYACALAEQLQKCIAVLADQNHPATDDLRQAHGRLCAPQYVENLCQRAGALPVTTYMSQGQLETNQETERQTESLQEREVDLSRLPFVPQYTPTARPPLTWDELRSDIAPLHALANYPPGDIFDANLYVSPSYKQTATENDSALFTRLQKALHFVVVLQQAEELRFVLVSTHDAHVLLFQDEKSQSGVVQASLIDINGHVVRRSGAAVDASKLQSSAFVRAMAQLKVIACQQSKQLKLTAQEREALHAWRGEGDKQKQQRKAALINVAA